MKFQATIKKGTDVATIHNRPEFNRFIQSLAHSEKDVPLDIEVKKRRSKRTEPQSRYYFGVCVAMIRERLVELGHPVSRDETHEFLKGRFVFNELVDENSGEVIKIPRSTTDLTKSEFSDFVEEVKRFAAETLQIYIPDAGEQLEIE